MSSYGSGVAYYLLYLSTVGTVRNGARENIGVMGAEAMIATRSYYEIPCVTYEIHDLS